MVKELKVDDLFDLVFCANEQKTEIEIIDTVLRAYTKKMDCFMTAVIEFKFNSINTIKVLPTEHSNTNIWRNVLNFIASVQNDKETESWHFNQDKKYFYIYRLKEYGFFILGLNYQLNPVSISKLQLVVSVFNNQLLQLKVNEQRKITEEKLVEEKHLLRTIIDNIPVNIYTKDLNYKKTLANSSELCSLGINSESEILGKTDFDFYDEEIAAKSFAEDKRVLCEGKYIIGAEEYMGNDKWALISKLPLYNERRDITGLIGISIDYTEKRKTQEQLLLFMNLFENLSDSVEIYLESGQLFYANKMAGEIHGINKNHVLHFNVFNLNTVFKNESEWNNYIRILKVDGKKIIESESFNKMTGLIIPTEVTLNFVEVNDNGYIISISRDISERKKAEEINKENEIRLEQIALKGRTFAWEIDTEGIYTYISPVIKEVLAYNPEELIGKEYFYNLQVAEKRESFKKKAFEQMGKRELVIDSVNLHYDKNGNPLWLSTNCFPLYYPDGSFKGYRGSDTDVTERVLNEERLREHEEFQQSLIENVTVGILIIDSETKLIEEVNSFAANIFQLKKIDIIGTNCNQYILNNDADACKNKSTDLITSGVEDDILIDANGKKVPVIKTIKKVIIKGKEKLLITLVDITDRKDTELKLRDSEERKSSLIQSMNDIVFVLNHDMSFIEIHKPENVDLYIFDEIQIGKQFEDVGLPDESLRIIGEALCNCMESGKITKAEFSIQDENISRWYEINVTILKNSTGLEDGLTCVIRDITDQRERVETIRQQIKLQELLINISTKYINIDLDNVQSIINESLKDMGQFVGADRSYIFNYDFKTNVTNNTFEWCADNISPEIDNLQAVPLEFFPQWVKEHKQGKAFYVPDVSELPDDGPESLRGILEPQGIKSLITIPMKYNDELLGFVGFDSVIYKHKFSFKEKQLLELYAQMIVNVEIRKRSVEMLTYQEEKYRNIISNINLGLVELDINDQVQFVNSQFCKMSGVNQHNLIGKYAGRLLLPVQEKLLLRYKKKIHSSSHYPSLELKVSNNKGNNKWWLVNGAPQYNDKKEVVGSVGVFLDITKQKLLQTELELSKQLAEKAAKAKEQFLTNMSHEIRTPLNVIIGMVRELGKENLTESQRSLVSYSEASAYHLLTIVNNILDMSKIEAGEFTLDFTDFSLSAALSDLSSILHSKAKSKKLDFTVSGISDKNTIIVGDVIRLRQVLINLLTNSIKFTDEGSVSLNVIILAENEGSKKLRFEIVDTGIGMSDEFQKRLFEKFTQEQDKANRSFEGTGLGMSISKQLVELMGGIVQVESEKSKGTRIWFDLDFKVGNIKNVLNRIDNHEFIDLKNVKVLLVEDNEMNRFIARQSLSRMQCEIVEAENGIEAVEQVHAGNFDIILMDIQMPKMDGVAATKYIRNELNRNIPILALTANAFKHDIDLYMSIGMNDFLIKPYKEDDLFKKIEQLLQRKVSDIESVSFLETEIDKPTPDNLYNLEQLIQIGQGDETFLNTMIEMFVKIASQTVSDMNEAVKIKDIDTINKLAHKIKPSIDNLEIQIIYQEIRQLEQFDININDETALHKLVTHVSEILNQVILNLEMNLNSEK